MHLPIMLALFKRSTATSLVSAALLIMVVMGDYSHAGGFLQGTLVRMEDGFFRQIHQIKENKEACCEVVALEIIEPQQDLATLFRSQEVVEVKEHPIFSHIEIVVGGETIHAAEDQKFSLFPQGSWVKASDLKVGMHLWSYYGNVVVESINWNDHIYHNSFRKIPYRSLAFELTLKYTHTYFVGTQMLLVHNADSSVSWTAAKDIGTLLATTGAGAAVAEGLAWLGVAAGIAYLGYRWHRNWEKRLAKEKVEEKRFIGKDPGIERDACLEQYHQEELAPNKLRAALPFPSSDPFGRDRYASTYGGLLFNSKQHSDLVDMLTECYTRRYLPSNDSRAFDECGNIWEYRDGALRASRGAKLILKTGLVQHSAQLIAALGKREYLIHFAYDFVQDPRVAVKPKGGAKRRPLLALNNAAQSALLEEDASGYATSCYNDLLYEIMQCKNPLAPNKNRARRVAAANRRETVKTPSKQNTKEAAPTNQIVPEAERQAVALPAAPPIPQQEAAMTPDETAAKNKELEDFYWEVLQINAEGRMKIRAVLVADKESFYSAWGEIDESGNFVGEQVRYDNGDIRIRLDGIDVLYDANNNDSGDDNTKTDDAEGDKEDKGKGDPNEPPKGPKDDGPGPKAAPPFGKKKKTTDDEKSTPLLKRGLTWVRTRGEKAEEYACNKTEENIGMENAKYIIKLWGWGKNVFSSVIKPMVFAAAGAGAMAVYYGQPNKAQEERYKALEERHEALEERHKEEVGLVKGDVGLVKEMLLDTNAMLLELLKQNDIPVSPAFGPSGN